MSDENERSVASDGSVVAWAVVSGDCVDSTFTDRDEAVEWAYALIPPPQIVPLYRHPTSKAVRLPQTPDDFEISEANGYAAAIADFKRALAEAGIEWTE